MTVAAIDRTAAAGQLTAEERLLLWGLRTWLAGWLAEAPILPYITRAFAEQGADPAVPALNVTMEMLCAARFQGFHHPWCRCLGDDERLLLDILSLHQRGESASALFLTRLLVPPAAARLIGSQLHHLAAALLACGITLSGETKREANCAAAPPMVPPVVWAPSTATLH